VELIINLNLGLTADIPALAVVSVLSVAAAWSRRNGAINHRRGKGACMFRAYKRKKRSRGHP
jgi:hypothetical protein